MEETVVRQLVALNAKFYEELARPFAASRAAPQAGYARLLEYLPQRRPLAVLDVGCGNGRFGHYLAAAGMLGDYYGVDFSPALATEGEGYPGRLVVRDLSRADCLDGLGRFDLVVCLSTLQHVPGRANRARLLREMAGCMASGGRVVVANWQFFSNPRQRRKIRPWAEAGMDPAVVEPNDYLLSWERGGSGLRYAAYIDTDEMRKLADEANLRVVDQFFSDGREGDLNMYMIMSG